jgi:hypothetical protein
MVAEARHKAEAYVATNDAADTVAYRPVAPVN